MSDYKNAITPPIQTFSFTIRSFLP
jgi:hypothetical protein